MLEIKQVLDGRVDVLNKLIAKYRGMNFKIWLLNLLLLTLILFFSSCKYTTIPEDTSLLEMERVWQYMRAVSIYQDRIPDEKTALSYGSPPELVHSIGDTLYSWATDKTYSIGEYYYSIDSMNNKATKADQKSKKTPCFSETVYFRKLTNNTAYIHIKTFYTVGDYLLSYKLFKSYTDDMANISNVIVDLRKNGGGYVAPCLKIIELFLPTNVDFLTVKERAQNQLGDFITYTSNYRTEEDSVRGWEEKNVVLLINNGTASASEIMAVALRDGRDDNHKITIIGEKSFGKGIGQWPLAFYSSGTGLLLTYAHFYPINGDGYHEKGIAPDTTISAFEDQVMAAGKILETNFESNLDSLAFEDVLSHDISKKPRAPRFIGCYKTPNFEELSF